MRVAPAEAIAPTRNRARNNASRGQKWTGEEDALLRRIVGQSTSMNWKALECQFPGKTSQQLFERWTKVLDPVLLKGSWTRQEDEIIIKYVHAYGCKSWTKLAKMLPGRIGKQCRERWMNHLNPDLSRDQWTPAEDQLLMELHREFGNSWSKIAARMPRRADNMIKNRWYSTLSKKMDQEVAVPAEQHQQDPPPEPSTPVAMPQPALEEITIDPVRVWTPTTFTTTPFGSTPGLISPMAPSASPFTLLSPYPKMHSMFSPWAPEPMRGGVFSPTRKKQSPPSLSENRAELVNLILNQ
jgi:hypothetical protein